MERFGFVGLPNAGKSSLFNALAGGGALAAPYPFATKDPNVGRAKVPDPRLDALGRDVQVEERRPRRLRVHGHRRAGGRAASKGEGLGNKFLGGIREVDTIVYVLRAFEDADVMGPSDPIEHLTTVETELCLADLETVDSQLPRKEKAMRLDKSLAAEVAALSAARAALDEGMPLYRSSLTADQRAVLKPAFLLTNKPVLAIVNVGEDDLERGDELAKPVVDLMGGAADVLPMCVQLEAEAAMLDASTSGPRCSRRSGSARGRCRGSCTRRTTC